MRVQVSQLLLVFHVRFVGKKHKAWLGNWEKIQLAYLGEKSPQGYTQKVWILSLCNLCFEFCGLFCVSQETFVDYFPPGKIAVSFVIPEIPTCFFMWFSF